MAAEHVVNTIKKSPGDTLRFVMDFSNLPEVRSGATISSITSVTATPSGLTISGETIEAGAKKASALFASGTDGQTYLVTFTVVLSAGQTVERTGQLRVTL